MLALRNAPYHISRLWWVRRSRNAPYTNLLDITIACGAINSCVFLLISANEQHPDNTKPFCCRSRPVRSWFRTLRKFGLESSVRSLQRELRPMVKKGLLLSKRKINRLSYRLNLIINSWQVATRLKWLLSLKLFAIVPEKEKFSAGLHLSKGC